MGSFAIKPNIYWVGARDWNVRSFHGPAFSTHKGTTYNCYLIKDEIVTLVDTVHEPFTEEMLQNLQEVTSIKDIKQIVINHVEPDHSGAFPKLVELIGRDVKVICSAKGKEAIEEHYGSNYNFNVVKTGDTVTTGKNTLTFIEASMLHWPDSMFTYIEEEALLLPNDAFGQHLCVSDLFDDQIDSGILMGEAQKYYANILTPFSPLIIRKIQEIVNLDLKIDMIAPSHGLIWRKDPMKIVNAYLEWAKSEGKDKIIVVYETMWESTEQLAKAIVEGIMEAGVAVSLYRMCQNDRNDILKEVLEAKGIIIGSSTINNSILPNLAPFLEELEVLKFKNKVGAAFGSHGWAGGAVEKIEKFLNASKIKIVKEGFKIKYRPTNEDLLNAKAFGKIIAEEVKNANKD